MIRIGVQTAAVARVAVVPLALLLLASCPKPSHVRNYKPPTADELLAIVRTQQAAIRGASFETRTTSWLGGERVRATVLMLVERDGKLRFEAEISLKGTVAALATDGRTFSLIDMERNTFKRGPACAENVASLVRIPLAPHEIAAILLGDAPVAPDARAVAVVWDQHRGAEILEVTSTDAAAAASASLFIALRRDARTGRFMTIGVEGTGPAHRGRWRVAYHDLRVVGDTFLPDTILFAEPGRGFDDGVEIRIRDRQVNPETSPSAFTLQPPDGFETIELPCADGAWDPTTPTP